MLALALAGVAQVLELVDPLILGRIIDDYVLNPYKLPESGLVRGVLGWLLLAVVITAAALLTKIFQNYVQSFVVQSS